MGLPKSIKTFACKTGALFCSKMKADFTLVFVIDAFQSGEDPEKGMGTEALWKTDVERAQ